MNRPRSSTAGPRPGHLTELTLKCWDEWQRRDWDTMAMRMDPRIVMDDVAEGIRYLGPQTVRERLERFVASFPDGQIEVRAVHEAAETTISELAFVGTNTGPIQGRPPTGRTVRARFCEVFTFADERIVHVTTYYDRLWMLKQLGLVSVHGNLGDAFRIRALLEALVAEKGEL
jgi:steroid delta-isomerase-like uncharacterized protein